MAETGVALQRRIDARCGWTSQADLPILDTANPSGKRPSDPDGRARPRPL